MTTSTCPVYELVLRLQDDHHVQTGIRIHDLKSYLLIFDLYHAKVFGRISFSRYLLRRLGDGNGNHPATFCPAVRGKDGWMVPVVALSLWGNTPVRATRSGLPHSGLNTADSGHDVNSVNTVSERNTSAT